METYGERALEHARAIAKPRRTGTPFERQARGYIVDALNTAGYRVWEEPFSFQPVHQARWSLYLAGLGVLGAMIAFMNYQGYHPFAATLAVGFLFYAVLGVKLNRDRFREALEGKQMESANVFCIPPGPPCQGPRVLFVAHYDSKSSTLSQRASILLAVCTFLLCLAIGVLAVLSYFRVTLPVDLIAILSGLLWVCILPMLFPGQGNRSPGATSNAAGVGALLELAERLRTIEKPHGTEIAFLFSGAKEEGVVGSMAFLGEHTGALHERPHEVINLDMVGGSFPMNIWGAGKADAGLEKRIRFAANQEQLHLQSLPFLPGALADHIPFQAAGVPAVTLTGGFGSMGQAHTARDEMRALDQEGLGDLVRLLSRISLHSPLPHAPHTLAEDATNPEKTT